MIELRQYQKDGCNAIVKEWYKERRKKTLLVLPTGCGKTICFAAVANYEIEKRGHRTLILAHREELLQQAADKIKDAFSLDCAFEKASSTALGKPEMITVGSVQSLMSQKRLNKFPRDYYSTVIVDEAHHALSDGYQRVLNYFGGANVLGVTATPDRGDKKKLGDYFESLAYEYSMRQAINDGYLCPIKALMIPVNIDLKGCKTTAGDYQAAELGNRLEPYLEAIANKMAEVCMNRKTVVFLPLIATSQKFCEMLKKRGFRAAEVNGDSPDRAEILSDFEAGKYNVICNSMLLTEGWDCPSLDCVVVLRPTKIRSLYQQMIGRGTRLAPGKKDLLILDFLWMTQKHDLCRPSCLLAKSEDSAKRMDAMMDGKERDLVEDEMQAERDIIAEREKALAENIKKNQRKRGKLVDPIQYMFSIADEDLIEYEPQFAWEMAPPTEKQLAMIEKNGIDPNGVQNKGHASMIIDRIIRRRDEGLCTPKQIHTLERYGYTNAAEWTFEEADETISAIADNGWRWPA